MLNPLFYSDDSEEQKAHDDKGYLVTNRHNRTIHPLNKGLIPPSPAQRHTMAQDDPTDPKEPMTSNAAVELIRRKVQAIYGEEPAAAQEIQEASQETVKPRSKHQQFMYELSTSGKSLAQIQTEWHNYYVQLPDDEKHQVWHEFYSTNGQQASTYTRYVQEQKAAKPPTLPGFDTSEEPARAHVMIAESLPPTMPHSDRRSASRIKKQIINRVIASESAQQKAKQHLKSLVFGLSTGAIVLVVFLFSFFNEIIIAPFIQPSRHVSATPIILSTDSLATSDTPEVIIPKINVEIPIIYDPTSVDEASIQKNLEDGVIHYATTVAPGQQGNAAFFGHSSNNIFNKGKYKFAFVLLHEMVPGDLFYLTYNKTVYTYRVFDKRVVSPTEVSVLNSVPGKAATATLITCDPPGTSTNRLVVWGEQISPDASGAAVADPTVVNPTTPTELSSNGPTLWGRFWNWVF